MSERKPITNNRLTLGGIAVTVIACVALAFLAQMSAFSTPSGPDTEVEVVTFEPSNETDRQSNITVKFSNALVPADSLDRPVLQPPLTIEPSVAGIARWIEKDVLRFYPDKPLAPATEYEVRVGSKEPFVDGNRIEEQRTFRFRTAYLEIRNVALTRTRPRRR
jgi:Big-like domain-containing protein